MRYKLSKTPFSLKHSLGCGQLFRWDEWKDAYYITTHGKILKIKQDGEDLIYSSSYDVNKKFIKNFLGLDHKLDRIYSRIDKDKTIHQAIERFKGLRILNQDPWECLISYICSANSSIPTIKKMLNNISNRYGRKLEHDGYISYSFPSPESLSEASLKDLRNCKLGFRSRYVLNAAKNYDSIEWNKESLMKLGGVGEKVANCVLLFSLKKFDAFPIDVWVGRIMRETYFDRKKVSNKKIQEFVRDYFGEYAGYAQEYLYYYRRTL